jgi:AcrR family transcriptional regulator
MSAPVTGADVATSPEGEVVHRPVGRPRSPAADQAILAATIDELTEVGFDELSLEKVAVRAGVGKATLYRRWSSKSELVVDAIGWVKPALVHPDTGRVRDDLIELLYTPTSWATDESSGRLLIGLCMELQRNPAIADLYQDRLVEPRREVGRQVLQRGIDRGEVRADVDLDVLVDLLTGTLFYRRVTGAGSLDRDAVQEVIDQVLAGARV